MLHVVWTLAAVVGLVALAALIVLDERRRRRRGELRRTYERTHTPDAGEPVERLRDRSAR